MRIFRLPEARYFSKKFGKAMGPSSFSIRALIQGFPSTVTSLREGAPDFAQYRDCLLREAERSYFLALSNYRRALDLMTPAGSAWAHVTLYYASFHAARSLIALFGGWMENKVLVDVAGSTPGKQEFQIRRKSPSTYNGPHQRFWDLFYQATPLLVPHIDPRLRFAVQPVASNVTWQIDARNEVNYSSYDAVRLGADWQSQFRTRRFPHFLPGKVSTQFAVSKGILLITVKFIREFRLTTDALDSLKPLGQRRAKIASLIYRATPPVLLRKSRCLSMKA